MKERHFDSKTALKAFNTIVTKGQKRKLEHHYKGLTASSDYDGYTVVIKNSDVSLTIFFHNKYNIEFKHKLALADFYAQIERIAKERA